MRKDKTIKVWFGEDTPEEVLAIVAEKEHIDYVALVPHLLRKYHIPWLRSNSFGCSRIAIHPQGEDEGIVVVGYYE
jgi:hypothetical protein